jgi:hypothetical protein
MLVRLIDVCVPGLDIKKCPRHWDTVAPKTALALSRCRLSKVGVYGAGSSIFDFLYCTDVYVPGPDILLKGTISLGGK